MQVIVWKLFERIAAAAKGFWIEVTAHSWKVHSGQNKPFVIVHLCDDNLCTFIRFKHFVSIVSYCCCCCCCCCCSGGQFSIIKRSRGNLSFVVKSWLTYLSLSSPKPPEPWSAVQESLKKAKIPMQNPKFKSKVT